MSQTAMKFDTGAARAPIQPTHAAAATQPVIVTLAEGNIFPTASPVRELHERLASSFAPPSVHGEKALSRRQRLLILAGLVASLWAMIGAATFALVR